jgi:hypothetical protein
LADIHAQVTGNSNQLAGGLEIKMGEWLDWESGWFVVEFPTTLATQQSTRQKLNY